MFHKNHKSINTTKIAKNNESQSLNKKQNKKMKGFTPLNNGSKVVRGFSDSKNTPINSNNKITLGC